VQSKKAAKKNNSLCFHHHYTSHNSEWQVVVLFIPFPFIISIPIYRESLPARQTAVGLAAGMKSFFASFVIIVSNNQWQNFPSSPTICRKF